jgi:hypothetical protein
MNVETEFLERLPATRNPLKAKNTGTIKPTIGRYGVMRTA